MGLLCLGLFYNINGEDMKSRYNMAGAVFFICVNNLMTAFMGTIGLFQGERPVFLREQANRMYGVVAYFNAKTLAELPMTSICPFFYSLIIYFGMGFS
jgi:hypothetical protein